jgi:3-oxoacyl-[acyl-carrier-protein] synthase II
MPDWCQISGLHSRVAGVCDIEGQEYAIDRKSRRSMGRVALLTALAAQDAVADAGLSPEFVASPACGVSFGSTSGGSANLEEYVRRIGSGRSLQGLMASHYLKCMSHTTAANLAVSQGCQGPLISSCTACTSGSQGVGFGYQAIVLGQARAMLCGGAEEMHFMHGAVFDLMLAATRDYNDRPQETPRPFDAARDGLAVAEGAGCLVLEDYEHARRRGATVHAEVLGFATNCNGTHLTNSNPEGIEACIRAGLAQAGLVAEEIGYINAHATATETGDRAEAEATHRVFGYGPPISSLKGHMGHTLGASGAIESVATVLMMQQGWLANTRNLDEPDPYLPPLNHIQGEPRAERVQVAMNNNFAFGGVNTSLILGLV